jgi:putative secretion ATPase (PEP-CTERM system associated)
MYEKHFFLNCKPFELLPNPEFLFQSSTHKKAITYLDYGIKEKIGFILLTGEIGSGKTTIIRNLIKNLDSSIRLSRVNNTKVTSEQLISMINEDFGLDVQGKNKTKLLSDLNEFLIGQYAEKAQPTLLIDEAQNLSPDLLEEIRLLSNLETDRAKLIQIILIGQPELNKVLMLPEMMQLRQRINISYHINPLTIDETVKYIRHRLHVAGNVKAINFEGDMSEQIYRFSRGIPRLINILCDLALLAAFVEGKKAVSADVVRDVIRDLESRDNWNVPQESSSSETAVKEDASDYQTLAGDIALRILKLESMAKESHEEINVLSERLSQLEENMSGIQSFHSGDQITKLLQRISSFEHVTESNDEKMLKSDEKDSEGPLADQVDVLKKMLQDVNRKLKKI